jgi:dihydrofolate reductase
MAKLAYSALASLDGFVADSRGSFDWAAPDEEVHGFVNDLERSVGTHLYGRGMYEVMVAWETIDDQHPVMRDYAETWKAGEKIVYSRTLREVASARTRIESEFEPEAVRAIKASASKDLSIGGPQLASEAIAAGLVDEIHLLLVPVAVGSGKPALPIEARLNLELLAQRRFTNGTVHLHYKVE